MAAPYNHREVEQKWQKIWDDEQAFKVSEDYSKPKYYALVEFPYPSGAGLHVGHPRPYTALDIVARKRRMQGYNVLYPMGFDAFRGAGRRESVPCCGGERAAGLQLRLYIYHFQIVF